MAKMTPANSAFQFGLLLALVFGLSAGIILVSSRQPVSGTSKAQTIIQTPQPKPSAKPVIRTPKPQIRK